MVGELDKIISEKGLKIDGLGIIINKLDKLIETNERLLNSLFHIETKIEALMDADAVKRLAELKLKFKDK